MQRPDLPSDTVRHIDALLPQTQCTRCGYAGCRPYAEALAAGEAAANRCPPGGQSVADALARLLQREALPLDPECGTEGPWRLALIDSTRCIGCARCLPPCPVDAIIGAARQLHTVFDEWCTGCELCISACPVDCIVMRPRNADQPDPPPPKAEDSRARYQAHIAREQAKQADNLRLIEERKHAASAGTAQS